MFDLLQLDASALDHINGVCIRQYSDAHEDGALLRVAHFRIVVLGAEHHVGDVTQPHQLSILLPNDELFEIIRGVQIRVGRQINLNQRALGLPDCREIIVGGQCLANLRRTNIQRRHPVGFEPDPHGKGASAKYVRCLHARDCGKTWLHYPDEIVRDLVRLQNIGGKTEIGRGVLRICLLDFDRGNFCLDREKVAD